MSRKIRAMYFSGTGTTEKIARAVAAEMYEVLADRKDASGAEFSKEEDIDFTPLKARGKVYSFDRDDVVVFGVPVIAGRVPNVLLKFLDTLQGGDALAVPVVLYGNRNFDDALIELRNILEDRGFHTVAGAAFIGEHSFSRILAAGRPDEADMKTAAGFARRAAEKTAALKEIPEPVEVDGEEPLRPYYKPRDRKGNFINILKVKPKLDKSRCKACSVCSDVCPMGSIKPGNPGVVDGICIKCCACVKKCPEGALYFDDPGYLYHKEELELGYAERREPAIFI